MLSQQAGGWQASFQRDVMGLETERLLPGGIQSQWKRDAWGRPLRHRVEGGGGLYATTHRQQNYEWGLHHRLKALTDPLGGMMQFEHDALGNLTKTIFGDGQQQLRNPDKVGNLFESIDQKDRHYDKGGKLLQSKGATYKYDEEGNLIEKKDKDGKRWYYEWNGSGMLAKVIRPDREEVSFGYDALGRRVWKRYGNTVTKWVWDGNKPLHEWKEHALTGAILSDTKVGSDGIITWLFEEDSFAPVAKLKGEKKYSIITDHLGTPAQMYTEDGKLCWQGALDSYGRMRMERGETGSCPFRYQGQYEDKEIGLYYNRFRYYSPEEGMYISQDPIRLEGGSKFYGYVDDPNGWIDPFGLAKCHTSGDLGNAQAAKDLTADGFTIVAREVTMEVNGSRMRADFVASKNGKLHVFEAKNKKSGYTAGQTKAKVFDKTKTANPNKRAGGPIDLSNGTSATAKISTKDKGRLRDIGKDLGNSKMKKGDSMGNVEFHTLWYDL